ncbi:MAG: MBL fold metallo-hydrolase [Gammaproteobacteria bacterium]|nr:MBL fold metallo-hydrolase [Gammaproteobacteria bacterium]
MTLFQDFSNGITLIDTGFQRPGLAACYLIKEGKGAILIDTGTTYTASRIQKILKAKGVSPNDVEYLFVTHIHLDHAGGAGRLSEVFPNARVGVHPRGAKHLSDPTQLVNATTIVLGEQAMHQYYGPVIPIPSKRILEITNEQTIDFHGRPLFFIHTAGHAKHHYCIFDAKSQSFFTGDTFGVSYRELDSPLGAFIFPATTPSQFDPTALHASINRLLSFKPKACYLTHFGQVTALSKLAQDLHALIDTYVVTARALKNETTHRHALLVRSLMILLLERLAQHHPDFPEEKAKALFSYDVEINAQGLEHWLIKSAQ